MGGLIGVDAPLLGLSSAIQGASAGSMAGTTAGAAPEVTAVLPPGGDAASAAAAQLLEEFAEQVGAPEPMEPLPVDVRMWPQA